MPSTDTVEVDPSNATPGFTKLHEAAIYHYAGNPSLETSFPTKFFQVLEGRDVSRLHGVLGFILGPENTAGNAEGSRIVAAEQFGHRGLVSLFALLDEVEFCFIVHSGPFARGEFSKRPPRRPFLGRFPACASYRSRWSA